MEEDFAAGASTLSNTMNLLHILTLWAQIREWSRFCAVGTVQNTVDHYFELLLT